METQVLKSIQIPNRTLELLVSFATSGLLIPPGARRLTRINELPLPLRKHVGIGPGKQYVWFAWCVDERVSLLTGALALELARERGRPVLEVRHYDGNGVLVEFATYVRAGMDRWEPCNW